MSKLLKNGGKLIRKNGKLVRTDDPANCDCCGPPPPPVKYICAIREDSCAQFPLNYGQWQYNSVGQWVIRRSRCAGQIPADTCTIADPPSRPGAFPGEIVNVGCKAVAPITTKECITEEEFNKGGWTKVSGPHDTLQICEEACNPPPPVQLWCCDGGTEGYFCGERVNVPGIGEMIGDAPIDICTSVKKVDDCSECGLPEYTTPGWYAICSAYEGDNGGQPNGIIVGSQRVARYYASAPTFPTDLGDGDWAVSLLGGPFASSQETEVWIENNGGRFKPCATVGEPIRPSAENPLP